jgi:predicted double-glycine peptidase
MPYSYYSKVVLPIKKNLQDTKYSCGPASLVIVCQSLGLDVSEEKMMEMAHTTPEFGSSPAELARALDQLNVKYEIIHPGSIKILEQKIRELNLCIVDYQAWANNGSELAKVNAGHYSVVFGFNADQIWLADPAKHKTGVYDKWGARRMSKELFNKHWYDKEAEGIETNKFMMAIPLYQKFIKSKKVK